MLKLTDEGAKITLQGQPPASDNGLFWFGSALLVGAIAVAMAMSVLSERLSIAALALLIIGSFFFNRQRQQRKKAMAGMINSGVLLISTGSLIHDDQGKRNVITLADGDNITLDGEQLQIVDANNVRKYHISGFDNNQEAQVAKAILQGQTFNKRHVTIKMKND